MANNDDGIRRNLWATDASRKWSKITCFEATKPTATEGIMALLNDVI